MTQQRLRLVYRRLRFKNLRLMASGAIELWRSDTIWRRRLRHAVYKAAFKLENHQLRLALSAWRNVASNIAYVRTATLGGFVNGVEYGAKAQGKAFSAWFNLARENFRLESAVVRVTNRDLVKSYYHAWNEHAIAWKRKAEKFGRLIFAFETQVCEKH